MENEKTGRLIYELRREKSLTQKQLADIIGISDKTVSKWECGLGCPDVSLLPELSAVFGVTIEQLLTGGLSQNDFVGGNMKKVKYFVCPECGNISVCTGNANVSCCSRKLEPLTPKKPDDEHTLDVTRIEDDWYIEADHAMKKEHYITFVAFATGDRLQIIKQYPEWNLQVRMPVREHGILLWFCSKHGLFYKYI